MNRNNITALTISEISSEYAKPNIPNICPRESIPITKTIIDVILVKTRWPLFSFPKNCEMYNVLMVVGIIQSEMIGTTSRVPAYSGNKMGRTWGTINIPNNAKTTEKSTVKSLIFFVLVPLESSGSVYFVTISGKTANMLRSCMAK